MAEEVSDIIYWIWRIIPVGILILFLVGILFNFLSTEVNTLDQEISVLAKTILSNPHCLAFEDNAKVYPFVIDKSKFTRDRLLICARKEDFGYKLKLKTNNETIEASTFNADQEMFYKVCSTVPEFKCQKSELFVLIQDKENLEPATLELEVIKRA